ncbi:MULTISPECIES: helix-turn-helix domain-containing protein [unclassified Mesorhizobium]|uniref:helix-turn-helix domain-containing protein n=1 Tax=unclassified Mesorhizobium TaxID=325217 RepID=UPI001FE20D80|nr:MULTISPECIES: helix-turn-helix domain-containing protein [unclassified Mesorhizobium]
MTDESLTIREVAELLKINEKTAYKLASAGQDSWLQGWRIVAVPAVGNRKLDKA